MLVIVCALLAGLSCAVTVAHQVTSAAEMPKGQSSGVIFPGDGDAPRGGDVHDPHVVEFDGTYIIFSTSGDSFSSIRTSRDLRTWKVWGPVLPTQPAWLAARMPHKSIWAPQAIRVGNGLRLYYCASERFGQNSSVIGLAECPDFHPDRPLEGWVDRGLLIESKAGVDSFNAIDAEAIVDRDGKHWMLFGSYWAGIYLTELDPKSGKVISSDPKDFKLVAANAGERGNPIEGAAVCHRGDYYYLFVSYGLAAQGVRSTYRIMVGRSKSMSEPFVGFDGKPMAEGGHTDLLKTSPPMFSPGHNSVIQNESAPWLMAYHYYDGRKHWHGDVWGKPTLQIRELIMGPDGWPLPGLPEGSAECSVPRQDSVVGKWTHQVDFGDPHDVQFFANGKLKDGDVEGTWTQAGRVLTVKWPKVAAPGEFWIDTLTLNASNTYYVGRNQQGLIIRGFEDR